MSTNGPSRESKTFCILPWIHLAVLPEGSAQLCCVASSRIESNGVPMSLNSHPLETIWNSLHLRNVRRDMLAGRHVADCSHCYVMEKNGGVSRRVDSNTFWAAELGPLFDALVEESRYRECEVSGTPIYYQLMPGNLCNLKCRMCFPHFSSQIERDPVHRQWVPTQLVAGPAEPVWAVADWTKGSVTLAPETVPGVHLDGFHLLETHNPPAFRWTNGNASLTVPLPHGVQPESLSLSLRGFLRERHRLRVLVNGTLVHDALVPKGGRREKYTFTVPVQVNHSLLTVQFQSDTTRPANDPRELGVAVERLELFHTGVAAPVRLPSGPWYRDDTWIREVLLQNADRLRGLYFTGGEPMIEKQVDNILQYLVEQGVAGNIVLECNTNCTILREAMLQKLQQFKEVRLGLSIDAHGAFYEYIRYPAKWDVIRRNVERLAGLSGERFMTLGSSVLQVYNVLNIVEILEFFDALGIPFTIQLATWPAFLNVGVLPRRVREVAAGRLRAYAEQRCRLAQRPHVLSVIEQIEKVKNQCTPQTLRNLMLFTNDLDASRQQNVRKVHGELLELLQSEGFSWTDERSTLAS